jgi:hypothetical protein
MFLSGIEAQNSADSPGDHRFLVGGDNVNSNLAALRGNYALVSQIAFLIDLDSKKF